jgi:hypothetical protein
MLIDRDAGASCCDQLGDHEEKEIAAVDKNALPPGEWAVSSTSSAGKIAIEGDGVLRNRFSQEEVRPAADQHQHRDHGRRLPALAQGRADSGARRQSEKDAKLAQKLGQLQPFIAVSPPECMGQLPSFGPT